MLNKLSYLNLFATPLYVIAYLRSGSPLAVLSIVAFVIINWLALLSEQKNDYRWRFYHYLFGVYSLGYALRLLYGVYQAVVPAITYRFISMDNFWYILATLGICTTTIWQVLLFYKLNRTSIN